MLAATIWGFSFVAQQLGAKYIGAFTFNGVRFALGAISLIPLILYFNYHQKKEEKSSTNYKKVLGYGIILGTVLFIASAFQQVGISGTTAGKAAFITGLYMVFVPLLGMVLKQRIGINAWLGIGVATIGLYLLCVKDGFYISFSDLLELAGALFFAIHLLLIDYFSSKAEALMLAFFQFITCSVLSLLVAVFYESITIDGLSEAMLPILYGGVCSVGIAYTLQIIGQKHSEPFYAAIILSLETVFATLGGFFILNEQLGIRAVAGCALMFAGMILSQVKFFKKH